MNKYPLGTFPSSTSPNSELSYFTPPDTPTTGNPATHPAPYAETNPIPFHISHYNYENSFKDIKLDSPERNSSILLSTPDEHDTFLDEEYPFEFTFESEQRTEKVVLQNVGIPEEIISYLRDFTVYDVMPSTNQVVIIDSSLALSSAISALVSNAIYSAPIWDNVKGIIYNSITPSNIFRALSREVSNPLQAPFDPKCRMSQIFPVSTHPSLVTVCAHSSLMDSCSRLLDHDLISIPVVDAATHSICYMLDIRDILQILYSKIILLDEMPACLKYQVRDIPVLISPVIEGFSSTSTLLDLFKRGPTQPPIIPIISVDGRFKEAITEFDILKLIVELSEEEFSSISLQDSMKFIKLNQTCSASNSLIELISQFVSNNTIWMILLDEYRSNIGTISVSRLISYILSFTKS